MNQTQTEDVRMGLPSASSFDADWKCPGRQNLLREMREQGIEEVRDTELKALAERGTRIHKAWETKATLELSTEELQVYKDGVDLERRMLSRWLEAIGKTNITESFSEDRLYLHNPDTLEVIASGAFDVFYVSEMDHGLIVDRKTGSGFYLPPASKSWQLRMYAVMAWLEYGTKNIRVGYVFPERFGLKLDWADFDHGMLCFSYQQIVKHLIQMRKADAPRTAGEHCVFCPARGICKEALAMATLPAITQAERKPSEVIAAMPPDKLKRIWLMKGAVTKILEQVQARLESLPDATLAEIGLKRTKGKETPKIVDVPGAFNALCVSGMEPLQILGAMSMPKGELVKAIQARLGLTEKEAESWFSATLEPYIKTSTSKTSIAEV